MKESTIAIHKGSYPDYSEGGVNTPIYASSAHFFPNPSGMIKYPRYSNTPTQEAPAEKIAALEHGEECLVFSTGMSAITTTILSLIKQGDHTIFQSNIYGGSYHFITSELIKYGIDTSLIRSYDPLDFEREITEKTKIIYIESPSNPLLRLIDIRKTAEISQKHNIVSIIDNTFATPINQKPLEMGIDIIVHSGTKYLNGHSDLVCGAVVTNRNIMKKITGTARSLGGSLDVFSSFLLDRGLKTLPIRMEKHNTNALKVAQYLEASNKVEKVYYPGLKSHPDHKLAKDQMRGYGGIVTFTLKGTLDTARRFTEKLKIIKSAISLGGIESSICFPFETSHAKLTKDERERQEIYDTTLRLSVGIEDTEDILSDLNDAL